MYENNNGYYQPNPGNPVPPPPYTPRVANDPAVDAYVESAFSKTLASAIMASIIAIIFGNTGLQLSEQARAMAAQRGVKISGKNIAAKVLGMVGKIGGIVMTSFWGIYLLILLIILMEAL